MRTGANKCKFYIFLLSCFLLSVHLATKLFSDLLIRPYISLLSSRLVEDGVFCVQSMKNITTSSLPCHDVYFKVISVQLLRSL